MLFVGVSFSAYRVLLSSFCGCQRTLFSCLKFVKKMLMYSVFTCSCKSVGGAKMETKRIRRRSISITPEIGDDIVRWVFSLLLIELHVHGKASMMFFLTICILGYIYSSPHNILL